MVNKWFIVGVVGVCIWAGFQLPGWFRSGAHLFKAGTAEMDLQISAGDLLGDCGYDLDNFERRRDPSGACVPVIRERLELAKTQGIIVAVQDKNRYGALCIEELLELSDDEVVRLYAGWASRERDLLFTLHADLLMTTVLHAKYRCPPQQRVQG